MSPARRDRRARAELALLLREGLIDAEQQEAIAALYPDGRWDWTALGRWFAIFGAVAVAAGLSILVREHFAPGLEALAAALAAATLGLLAGGRSLAARRPAMIWTRRGLELTAGFAIIGLSFTIGLIVSTGSGNWPALLLIDLVLLLPLAYALANPLLLVLSAVVFFCWFGGVTGYASGWGMYWFGMSYPLRFALAALAMGAFSIGHRRLEDGVLGRVRGFHAIWLSAALFFGEMALWLMSLFGNFDLGSGDWHRAGAGELLAFNGVWLAGNVALIAAGARSARRMVVGYGVTFLVIQAYTLYFMYLTKPLGPFLSLLVAGAATLALAFWLERRLRARKPG